MSTSIQWWPARPIDANSFTDIVPNNPVESINWPLDPVSGQPINNMIVTFGGPALTTVQRYEIIRRMRTTPPQEEIEKQAVNAWSTMDKYLKDYATVAPTAGAAFDQIKLLTKVTQYLVEQAFPIATQSLLPPRV